METTLRFIIIVVCSIIISFLYFPLILWHVTFFLGENNKILGKTFVVLIYILSVAILCFILFKSL